MSIATRQQPYELRRASAEDSRACFAVFRRSLHDLMRRTGYVAADSPPFDADAQWPAYTALFEHLAATGAHWWLAHDEVGEILGYARSIEREGLLELTEFFVAPDRRVAGIGRALLERAFPLGEGPRRSVIATVDAPAVGLYLRFGVAHETTGVGMVGTPRPAPLPRGYATAPAALEDVLAIEREVLGHGREPDIAHMLADRQAVMLLRGGRPAGYVFGPSERGYAGPIATLEPEDMPAALAVLETAAAQAGQEQLDLTVPLAAHSAVAWLTAERGFRVDPFYCLFLADGPWAKLDRYLPFNPCLML